MWEAIFEFILEIADGLISSTKKYKKRKEKWVAKKRDKKGNGIIQ